MERQLEAQGQKVRHETKLPPAPLQSGCGPSATTASRRPMTAARSTSTATPSPTAASRAAVELTLTNGESPMGPQGSTVRPICPIEYLPERGRRN